MALFFCPCFFLSPLAQKQKRTTVPHSISSSPSRFFQCFTTPASFPFYFPRYPLKKTTPAHMRPFVLASSFGGTKITDFDTVVDEQEPEEDLAASPWEGAVVYLRDPAVTHVEYWTTLERLGLARLSSGVSRSRASAMGIRIPTMRAKESELSNKTPVLVSIDVTRRKRRLKLDGILRTVITLGCNRCAEPAAESVFSNFTLLLTGDPVDEEREIKIGAQHGSRKAKSSSATIRDEMEDDEKLIEEDDKLYFPPEAKEVDLSKHIRDLVHVEITINAVCSPSCRGLCLKCGTNLNHNSSCNCSEEAVDPGAEYGPLGDLRRRMQSEP